MKIKVIREFKDKQNDLVTRTIGTVYDCDEDRATELIVKGFAAEVKLKKKTKQSD